MASPNIVVEVAQLVQRNLILEAENSDLKANSIQASKFYNSAFTTEMVASLHGVSTKLVRKYVSIGMIPTHENSTDGKILIRGSVALLLDFEDMKRKAKIR